MRYSFSQVQRRLKNVKWVHCTECEYNIVGIRRQLLIPDLLNLWSQLSPVGFSLSLLLWITLCDPSLLCLYLTIKTCLFYVHGSHMQSKGAAEN